MYQIIIYAILFFILSPGIFINIPPIHNLYWMTNKTDILSAFLHAIIFSIIIYIIDLNLKNMNKSNDLKNNDNNQKKGDKGCEDKGYCDY